MEEQVQWIIAHEELFFHPWLSVISSWVAYAAFGFALYACSNKRVLWKRMPDVLIILLFAFFTDLLKMRMNLYFIYRTWNKPRSHRDWELPTTVAACTLGMWVFYSHFLITFVEAIVSIFRFVKEFMLKGLNQFFVFFGVACVCAVQVAFLFETFLHGTPGWTADFPIHCTSAYTLNDLLKFNKWAMVSSMAVAPVLSFLLIIREIYKRNKQEAGVSAFTFVSSLALSALVHGYMILDHFQPKKYETAANIFIAIVYVIQDFRFPFLCMLAMFFVADIRGALCSTIMEPIRKLFGHEKMSESFNNEV